MQDLAHTGRAMAEMGLGRRQHCERHRQSDSLPTKLLGSLRQAIVLLTCVGGCALLWKGHVGPLVRGYWPQPIVRTIDDAFDQFDLREADGSVAISLALGICIWGKQLVQLLRLLLKLSLACGLLSVLVAVAWGSWLCHSRQLPSAWDDLMGSPCRGMLQIRQCEPATVTGAGTADKVSMVSICIDLRL